MIITFVEKNDAVSIDILFKNVAKVPSVIDSPIKGTTASKTSPSAYASIRGANYKHDYKMITKCIKCVSKQSTWL